MIGVGIVSFNRPYYLRRALKALEAQTELDNTEFHLFQDGAVNLFNRKQYANDFDIARCVKLFDKARLPGKQAHVQEHNVGISINQREGIDWLAAHYDRLIIVEDDALLSPHWFRLARLLFDKFDGNPDVFGFTPGFRRMCTDDAVWDNLGYVQPTTQHMWTECFTADNWRAIQEHMTPYYEMVNCQSYGKRPVKDIKALHKARGVDEEATSQDAARNVAVKLAGMVRMQCTVNRGLCIGRQGVHFNGGWYDMMRLGEQTPYVFEGDAAREGFDWLVPQN